MWKEDSGGIIPEKGRLEWGDPRSADRYFCDEHREALQAAFGC